MTAQPTLETRLYEALTAFAVPSTQREIAIDLCESVVAMARECSPQHPGRAARAGVQLLLQESTMLAPSTCAALGRLCEVAVVRG
jgi:hypothetical protein